MPGNHVVLGGLCPQPISLVVPKEEETISNNGSTQLAAELVAAQLRYGEAATLVEERVRCAPVGTVEAEDVPLESVRTGRCNQPNRGCAARGIRTRHRSDNRHLTHGV